MNESKTTNQKPVWELTPEEALTTCDIAKFLVLRSAHLASGNPQAITDLQNQWYRDKQWRAGAITTTRADELKATAEALREEADSLQAIAQRITATDEERTTARHAMEEARARATNESEEAQDIDKLNSRLTASEGEAIYNAIYVMYLRIVRTVANHPDMKPDPDKAFNLLCKAGRQQLETLRGLQSLDTVQTTSRPLTIPEAVELMTRYNIDPNARPRTKWTQTAKDCTANYYTLEGMECKTLTKNSTPEELSQYARYNDMVIWYHRNITLPGTSTTTPETLKAWDSMTPAQQQAQIGLDPADNPILCEVLHRPSYRRIYDLLTRGNEDNTPDEVTAEATAVIDIKALADRAKLTDRQRTAVKALTTPEAVAHATEAYNASWSKSTANIETKSLKPYRKRQAMAEAKTTADNAYISALWGHALTTAEVKQSQHANQKSYIVGAMVNAYHKAPDKLTPGTIDLDRLMKRPGTIANTDRTQRPDMVAWTAEARADHKPVIKWTEETNPATYQHTTQAEADRQRAKAHADHMKAELAKSTKAERARHEYRQSIAQGVTAEAWTRGHRDTMPKSARASALAIWDCLTARQQDYIVREAKKAEARAEAERAEAERRAKFPAWVYTLNSTFQQWSEANEETRAEHMAYLNSL